MVDKYIAKEHQKERFFQVAGELGLEGGAHESLDRIMSKLDLKKKPDPKPEKK